MGKKNRFAISSLKVSIPDLPPDILSCCQKRFHIKLPKGFPNDLHSLASSEIWSRLPVDIRTILNHRAGQNLHLKLQNGQVDPKLITEPFRGSPRKALIRQPKTVLTFLEAIGALDNPEKLSGMTLSSLGEGLRVSPRVAFSHLLRIRRDIALTGGSHAEVKSNEATTLAEGIRNTFAEIIPASMKERRRVVDILCARYGCYGEEESTLQAVGNRFDLTRERIRQLQAKITDRAAFSRPSPGLIADLRERIQVLALLPSTVDELQASLEDLLGESQSLEGVSRFSREVLGYSPGFTICPRDTKTVDRRVVSSGDQQESISRSAKHVRKAVLHMTGACGAAQIDVVRGFAASNGGELLSDQAIASTVSNITGFRWLDERTGWFWLATHPGDNAVLTAVRKIMTVSERRLDIEELYPAILRFLRKRYSDREPYLRTLMPPWVLTELLKQTDWLNTVQKEYFELRDPDTLARLRKELSRTELFALDLLDGLGNVASRMELRKAYRKVMTGGEMALHVMLDRSPILYRSERSVFALVGREIDVNGLKRARRNIFQQSRKLLDVDHLSAADTTFTIQLTAGTIRNHYIRMPIQLARLMQGQELTCHGAVTGSIRINNARMVGMYPLLKNATVVKPGRRVRFVLDPAKKVIDVFPL